MSASLLGGEFSMFESTASNCPLSVRISYHFGALYLANGLLLTDLRQFSTESTGNNILRP
jgi:hypothetical protein